MKTIITNLSGETRILGYLPPHARTLADNASVELDGDLKSVLAAGRGRYNRSTELTSLVADQDAGDIDYMQVDDTASAPVFTSVTASSGTHLGGTVVHIVGTGFVPGTTVKFATNLATAVSIVDADHITCTTPAHANGAVNVVITNPDAQVVTATNAYTYT